MQKLVALVYVLLTRLPRLGLLPKNLSERGWAGIREGFTLMYKRRLMLASCVALEKWVDSSILTLNPLSE